VKTRTCLFLRAEVTGWENLQAALVVMVTLDTVVTVVLWLPPSHIYCDYVENPKSFRQAEAVL
jgi:hypothetical protein